jgi:lysozyme
VDFCFNAGRGALLGSTLLRKVNAEDFEGAAAQFGLWVHAGGEVVPGLVRRRTAEAALFCGESLPAAA